MACFAQGGFCIVVHHKEILKPEDLLFYPLEADQHVLQKQVVIPLKQTKEYLALRLEDFVMLRCNTKLMLLVFFSFLRMLNSVHVETFIQFFKEH